MILSREQLQDIILHNPNANLLSKGQSYAKTLRYHMRGVALEQQLTAVKNFETPSLHDLRVKYSKSNKDIFSRLSRPIDKVFAASKREGSVEFHLSDAQNQTAAQLAANVKDGLSARKWVETYWLPHYLDDPYGIILMELAPAAQALELQQQGKPYAYPTYKASTAIYDYLPKGNRLEYIALHVSKGEKAAASYKEDAKIYRVIDDAFDYWVLQEGKDVRVLLDHTFANQFGYVPAILNSDIVDPEITGGVLSMFDEVIEMADQFLLKGSIKSTHDFMHGFPKYWQFASGCKDCAGTGLRGGQECASCKGTGKAAMTRVSDAMLLDIPDKTEHNITPNVAGYVSPDKTYWEIATADLAMLEDLMTHTVWGVAAQIKTAGMAASPEGAKTATEVMTDTQPQADRLNMISDSAQARHKFILDAIVEVQVAQGYTGSSVQYGRRFLLEGPDVLKEKYESSKQKMGSPSMLDELYRDYLNARCGDNDAKYKVEEKLFLLEPFFHWTVLQVQAMPIADAEKATKTFFSEWRKLQPDNLLLVMPIDLLRADLEAFAAKKGIVAPEPAKPAFP